MVGPSGAGKGSLLSHLTSTHPDKFGFSVSFTTRPPRESESNGIHYNFVTKDKFTEMVGEE